MSFLVEYLSVIKNLEYNLNLNQIFIRIFFEVGQVSSSLGMNQVSAK